MGDASSMSVQVTMSSLLNSTRFLPALSSSFLPKSALLETLPHPSSCDGGVFSTLSLPKHQSSSTTVDRAREKRGVGVKLGATNAC
jgi:hypothetical protein